MGDNSKQGSDTGNVNETFDPVGEDFGSYSYPETPESTRSHNSLSSEQLTVSTILGLEEANKIRDLEAAVKVESRQNSTNESNNQTNSSLASAEYTLKKEKWYSITIQIFIPFMIAGVGTIGAGIVLGTVQGYEVFKEVKALFILVPSILGLKGNLDMCLASRLSTQANLGHMDSKREFCKMIVGNVGLVQVQAIVAACLVSIFAVSVSAIMTGVFEFNDALLLASSSVITATVSCFILDFVLIGVISIAHKLHMNPDNLATPLAASIGDVVSLVLLSTVAGFLYKLHDSHYWIMYVILVFYLCFALPFWILIVRKNKYTKSLLLNGWVPVLSALFISGMGGLVLDSAVQDPGFVVFQPIINGIGGNLVSVQSSRISTMLHQTSLPGIFPPHTKHWVAPWSALFKGVFSAKTARILIAMSVPGQTVFVFVADLIYNEGVSTVTPVFVLTYLGVGLFQIMLLLYIAHIVTHTMWKFKMDPDNSAIPYLTALGDLLGSCFLFAAFMFLKSINKEYQPVI